MVSVSGTLRPKLDQIAGRRHRHTRIVLRRQTKTGIGPGNRVHTFDLDGARRQSQHPGQVQTRPGDQIALPLLAYDPLIYHLEPGSNGGLFRFGRRSLSLP